MTAPTTTRQQDCLGQADAGYLTSLADGLFLERDSRQAGVEMMAQDRNDLCNRHAQAVNATTR